MKEESEVAKLKYEGRKRPVMSDIEDLTKFVSADGWT